jgi:hypothetical protein
MVLQISLPTVYKRMAERAIDPAITNQNAYGLFWKRAEVIDFA